MKCPHCSLSVHPAWTQIGPFGPDSSNFFTIRWMTCPGCSKGVVNLVCYRKSPNGGLGGQEWERQLYPRTTGRPPVPLEVPPAIADDYTEACLVLTDSPKASAALSRRVLQHVLRDKGFKDQYLWKEIDKALASKTLPSHVTPWLDIVRKLGNIAAHPTQGGTGQVLDVEPHEAEAMLDTVESLFDFYYVQPAAAQAKLAAINVKLASAKVTPKSP